MGSEAVDAQVFPRRNSLSPISFMAGSPEIIRYTVIKSTDPTVTIPKTKNMPWIIFSSNCLCFIFSTLKG